MDHACRTADGHLFSFSLVSVFMYVDSKIAPVLLVLSNLFIIDISIDPIMLNRILAQYPLPQLFQRTALINLKISNNPTWALHPIILALPARIELL